MVKAIVTGVAGRMGGRIVHMMEAAAGIQLVGAVESPGHAAVGKDVGQVVGLPSQGVKVVDSLDQVLSQGEVVIEFTHPEPSLAHLHQVADAGKAMVLGTTGFSPGWGWSRRTWPPSGATSCSGAPWLWPSRL